MALTTIFISKLGIIISDGTVLGDAIINKLEVAAANGELQGICIRQATNGAYAAEPLVSGYMDSKDLYDWASSLKNADYTEVSKIEIATIISIAAVNVAKNSNISDAIQLAVLSFAAGKLSDSVWDIPRYDALILEHL